jgi:L-threonylcarbamoyladenylate synthase
METELFYTNSPIEFARAVAHAVEFLNAGEPVALPTETVYGLAADATRADAAVKIFEAKQRPFFDPLIVHLPDLDWLERIAHADSPLAAKLIEKFWPGPLTLVLRRRDIVPDIVTSGLATVAVRMSAHPVFRAVASAFGKPLAAPSANPFGRISPTTAQHVQDGLDGRIPLIVDGGPCAVGIESTIVAVEGERMRILRSGPITADELAAFGEVETTNAGATPEAAGQLKCHYAPRTPLRLLAPGTHFRAHSAGAKRIGSLAFEAPSASGLFASEQILSLSGDLREAAATLFAKLRCLDEAGLDLIIAEPVPEHGLGIAIMDRLRKAAAHE